MPEHEQRDQAMHQTPANPAISKTENDQLRKEIQSGAMTYDMEIDSSQLSKFFESPLTYSPRFPVSKKEVSAASSGRLEYLKTPSTFHSNHAFYSKHDKNAAQLETEYRTPNSFGTNRNVASRAMEKNTYKDKQVSEIPDLPPEDEHENRPLLLKERFVYFMSFILFYFILCRLYYCRLFFKLCFKTTIK